MKTTLTQRVGTALFLVLFAIPLQAQTTAFTYQGRLNDGTGLATGIYDLRFTIYGAASGGSTVAGPLTLATTAVSNGLFTVTLDFGAGVFTGADRWLEIGVRTNGSISAPTPLVPRQPLTASPYAVHAGTVGAVSWDSISGVPVAVMSNMLGSVGNEALELKVNGQRALRLEPTTNAPNLIGGHGGNFVSNGVVGATIAGGGAPGLANLVGASHGTVGGGIANAAVGAQSVVAGGGHNVASGRSAFIGGGGGFDVGGGGPYPNMASGDWSTIGGGWLNRAWGYSSIIAGGALNESGTNALFAAIGGGVGNINLGYAATIAGGYYNRAENNSAIVGGGEFNFASGVGTTIAGGASNTNLSPHATIAGGRANLVEPGADLSAIGGGWLNFIQSSADQSVIAGGNSGRIEGGSRESFIGGGFANTIRSNSPVSFIGGGAYNTNGPGAAFATISGGQNGLNSGYAGTIAGGYYNTVTTNGSTVGGGSLNTASGENSVVAGGERNTASGDNSVVAGGEGNFAQARRAVIGGGAGNSITNQGNALTIGGGQGNHISSGQNYSTIAGGVNNLSANRADRGFIGGGSFNTLGQHTYHGTIGGGQGNATFFNAQYPTLLGGLSNLVNSGSVIPGGLFNTNAGNISVISGGENNYIGFLADHSVIGGGAANRVVGSQLLDVYAIVGGGGGNTVQTNVSYSTISGGRANTIQANAHYAAIPGGFSNEVAGAYGFAAGRRAKANHPGAFVWADSTDTNFVSTATNQFSVRASGGVRLETGGAGMTLDGVDVLSGIVPNASLAGTYASALTLNNPGNAFTGEFSGGGTGLSNVNAATLGGLAASNYWQLGGNSDNAYTVLGTRNDRPLMLIAYNQRGLQLDAAFRSLGPFHGLSGANVTGGAQVNSIWTGVLGGTIGGGGINETFLIGGTPYPNIVSDDFGTVGGGLNNTVGNTNGSATDVRAGTVGGGESNWAGTNHATVAGGGWNFASGISSFIGGGGGNTFGGPWTNTASGNWSAILGGWNNTASGYSAVVGGGGNNIASGTYAVVPGGDANRAEGDYSFAAGRKAKANHSGSFVWADSQSADFDSTTNNQFSIRANRGVVLSDDTPSLSFGTTTRQMLNLWGTGYGIGVQSSAAYFRTDNEFFWYRGGSHSDAFSDPGDGGSQLMRLGNDGSLIIAGTLLQGSDRGIKQGFAAVNAQEVLEKVAALPIQTWTYTNNVSRRHLGPVAQDFHAAFGLNGADDKHIATVDADGVALAAIQGLNQKLTDELKRRDAENAELKTRLEKLERLLDRENGGAK